ATIDAHITGLENCQISMRTICNRFAPMIFPMPISLVRGTAMNAASPYKPVMDKVRVTKENPFNTEVRPESNLKRRSNSSSRNSD
ncbi:MAG: hypothetical protein QGH99_09070, partial [Pseudomonadales bacterium]|nr:hypothetical protein [Pseudomonadales bacterium]